VHNGAGATRSNIGDNNNRSKVGVRDWSRLVSLATASTLLAMFGSLSAAFADENNETTSTETNAPKPEEDNVDAVAALPHQEPTYRFPVGHSLEGWLYFGPLNADGIPHGFGQAIQPYVMGGGGQIYLGDFKDGVAHGNGTASARDGTITHGVFANGKFESGLYINEGRRLCYVITLDVFHR
jgi:hypothetical protein